jgi:AcrR family transcriptional regulator
VNDTLDQAPALVWERPARARRRPAPDEAAIAAAAVALADREGLDAVTMRRLATELGTGTTSLYRYIADKDELFERMLDAAHAGHGDTLELTGQWRQDLRAVAHLNRDLMLHHPWLASQRAVRPAFGPNALARINQALAAAASLSQDATIISAALTAVLDYVAGAAGRELAEREACRRSGLDQRQWRTTLAPYLRTVIADGHYPHLARRITDADDLDFSAEFDFGLDSLLDGIAARAGIRHDHGARRPDGQS